MLIALRPTQEAVDIVASLRGNWHGSYALCRCPAHSDNTPSLSIRQGNKGILVHCFAGCDPENILRAIGRLSPPRGAPIPDFAPSHGSANARRIWDDAREISGTLAELYLRRRNLPVDLPDIRFHPRCPFRPKPHTRFLPALIVAVRQGQQITAIQRIFLNPETHWHTGKYMLGRPGMGAWRQKLTGTTLAIAEGFEDAAAFTKQQKTPCWASLGAERLPLLALPDFIETLVIAEDDNSSGRAGALRALHAYRRPGLTILRRSPRPFDDWAAANEAAPQTAP